MARNQGDGSGGEYIVKIFSILGMSEFIRNGAHKEMANYRSYMGGKKYGSIKCLEGYNLSRRDDIESLGYIFLHILTSEQAALFSDNTNPNEILEHRKEFLTFENLTEPAKTL